MGRRLTMIGFMSLNKPTSKAFWHRFLLLAVDWSLVEPRHLDSKPSNHQLSARAAWRIRSPRNAKLLLASCKYAPLILTLFVLCKASHRRLSSLNLYDRIVSSSCFVAEGISQSVFFFLGVLTFGVGALAADHILPCSI
jgi:hypothetical protein